MTNFQKAFCALLSLCFFMVLILMPRPFYQSGNVYRSLPLYRFLEKRAESIPANGDARTNELLVRRNGEFLAEKVQKENEAENREAAAADGKDSTEKQPERKKPADQDSTENKGTTKSDGQENDRKMQSGQKEMVDKVLDENGDKALETEDKEISQEQIEASAVPHPIVDLSPEKLADYDYLLNHFFIVDGKTAASPELLNAKRFLKKDMTLQKNARKPQIAIYHTHSQETFSDSREGEEEDTVVGVGNYLTSLLTDTYGYQVIHVKETFDIMGGELDRSRAYDYAREYMNTLLEENPTIEVVIDLHRDGVPEDRHLLTEINGKPTAQIMFHNGLSYTLSYGPVDYLPNPYIEDNLAFSFQLEYQAACYYPELYRGIYLAGLRYNLHLRPRTLLLEAGAQTNTVQEVKNAMEPFADILDKVLRGNKTAAGE